VLGSGLGTGLPLVQGVLPNVLDEETEAKWSVSRMPYAPSRSNTNKPTNHFIKMSVFHFVGTQMASILGLICTQL
jgi:hypothetical protein